MTKITSDYLRNLGSSISPEAERLFEDAVVDYIVWLTGECVELAGYAGRITVKDVDVDLVLRYKKF